MTNQHRQLQVVVGVDDSPTAHNAAQFAADLAGLLGTSLVVAHGYQLGEEVARQAGLFADLKAAGDRLVNDIAGDLHLPPGVGVTTVADLATPSELLGRLAEHAQVVVLGQHPAGWLGHVMYGNPTAHIVDELGCPAVIVPDGWRHSQTLNRDVMVALDGKSAARPALDLAVTWTTPQSRRVVAVHALPPGIPASQAAEEESLFAEILAGVKQDNPDVTFTVKFVEGDPEEVILDLSNQAGVVVLSKPGHRWPGAWAASVAHAVITRANCPLAIAPHDTIGLGSIHEHTAHVPLAQSAAERFSDHVEEVPEEARQAGVTKALVVYESMWGNTERVAQAITAGLQESMEATLTDVSHAPPEPGEDIGLIVAGGPTHAFSMTRPSTRADAHTRGAPYGNEVIGLREWLASLPSGFHPQIVATFDTRVAAVRHLPGSAAKGAAKAANRHGYARAAPAESFYVDDMDGPLLDGELERATSWARELAAKVGSEPPPG